MDGNKRGCPRAYERRSLANQFDIKAANGIFDAPKETAEVKQTPPTVAMQQFVPAGA